MTVPAIFGMAEQVFQTIGVAGFAALWALKIGITAIFYKVFQKKTGHKGPIVLGWIYRQLMKRRIENGSNGR
ncbi:MAG: hypothetical protein CML68_16800 [Rhodobacteraceae bacterium]|nr:hypothetical protein [Paracoccaceae bacterium]